VASGAAVEINGTSALTIPESFNLNGSGISSGGAIRLVGASAAATLTGGLTAVTASRINTNATSATSTLTINTIGISNTSGITFGVTSAGSIEVSSTITGTSTTASTLTKDGAGAGKLILSTANTYAGATSITAGTLQITNNDALGTNTQSTTISSTATLELNGVTTLTEPLNLNGVGVSSLGAVRVLSTNAAATLSGLITVQTATRINTDITSGTNTLTISGGITNTNGLTLGGVGDVSIITTAITGSTPSSSNLTKDGGGKLFLSTTNTYAGTTSITSGIVRITNADALGTLALSNGTLVGVGAAIEIDAATTFTIPEAITINGTGVSNTGAIRLLSSSLAAATLSGTITVASASRINTDITSGTNTLTIAGGITASANLSLGTTSAGGITVSSAIGGTGGGIEKDGTGTGKLLLTTANTYTGATSITYGIIQIHLIIQSWNV
jgi:autotransporter-associated beta strand protein